MPIFPGPGGGGGSSALDMMLDLGAALAEYGDPIDNTAVANGRPGLAWDYPNGDIRIFLENSTGANWSGTASWVIPLPQSAIDAGSLVVEIAAECGSDSTLPSCTLGVTAIANPQSFNELDPVFITATPATVNMVPFAGAIEIVSFTVPLAGVTANSTFYLGIYMQMQSPAPGDRAFIQMWNVRVAQAGA